jgi:hypothetical protein
VHGRIDIRFEQIRHMQSASRRTTQALVFISRRIGLFCPHQHPGQKVLDPISVDSLVAVFVEFCVFILLFLWSGG